MLCAVTARWALTAAASGFAVLLGVVLSVPDQIFATITRIAFLAAVAPSERPPPSGGQTSSARSMIATRIVSNCYSWTGIPPAWGTTARPRASHNQLVSPDH